MKRPGGGISGPPGKCSANMSLAAQAIAGLQPHFPPWQPTSAELCLVLAQTPLYKAWKGTCQVRVTTQVQFFQEMSLCSAHKHGSPHRHHSGGPPRVADLASGEPAPLEPLWQPSVCSLHSAQDLTPWQCSTLLLCLGEAALAPLLSLQHWDVAFPEIRGWSETLTVS